MGIAHDVDPIEIVMWMPALCHKLDVPYCIVKGRAALGQLVGRKTVSCVAFESVRQEDKPQLDSLTEIVKAQFNDRFDDIRKNWGGLELGRRQRTQIENQKKRKS
eukprot:NODE_4739_length_422_cov_9355.005362_g3747_i0.p1 GENE.NODE_4739_length_422_cov_9355.005362_g3747_i0~~NODE_4739_length_422_cov_9355.005362_g3747_i0.p1  ORF type:complete len:114 (-),score=35.79 NODE_4739_length_422_cov_9355.005362_g3747_i0:79-393(-)